MCHDFVNKIYLDIDLFVIGETLSVIVSSPMQRVWITLRSNRKKINLCVLCGTLQIQKSEKKFSLNEY